MRLAYEGEKKLETQAQMYEEKIIELHSVIAELTKQCRKQGKGNQRHALHFLKSVTMRL